MDAYWKSGCHLEVLLQPQHSPQVQMIGGLILQAGQHGHVLWRGQGRQGSTQQCPPNKQLSLEPKGSKQGRRGSAVRTHQQQHGGLDVQSTGQRDAHAPAPAEQVSRAFLHDLCEAQAMQDLASAGLC